MNKNLQEPTTQVSARRRLVRGVFAAPVALTLYNGSAFAAASNSCVAKEVANPTYPGTIATLSPSDTYLRVRLWTLPSGTPSAWVKGSDVTALQVTGAPIPYIQNTQWQCFVVGVNPSDVKIGGGPAKDPVAGTLYNSEPRLPTGNATPTKNGSYVALRIDSTGKIVGVVGIGVAAGGTSAVHQSCWASFKPVER